MALIWKWKFWNTWKSFVSNFYKSMLEGTIPCEKIYNSFMWLWGEGWKYTWKLWGWKWKLKKLKKTAFNQKILINIIYFSMFRPFFHSLCEYHVWYSFSFDYMLIFESDMNYGLSHVAKYLVYNVFFSISYCNDFVVLFAARVYIRITPKLWRYGRRARLGMFCHLFKTPSLCVCVQWLAWYLLI